MPRPTTAFTRLLLLTTTALSLVSGTLAGPSGPNQCIAFDASWNLLAFNFDSKDLFIPSSSFTPSPATSDVPTTDITQPSGRPPFNVPSSPPLCYTSQFTNAVYVLNADAADPSSVYIFDATTSSWSKQTTTLPPASKTSLQSYDITQGFNAILDRDTNVFYALTQGNLMMSLNMGLLKRANESALSWNEVQEPVWDVNAGVQQEEGSGAGMQGYEFPTMALAQNHVHFLGGVPGLKEGEAKIFVIHYSYLQPEPQSYGTPAFPTQHGKTASFFRDDSVQTQFAYIPDDASSTYVVDVTANSTTALPGPALKDPHAQYAASPGVLVQLSSEGGKLSYITYDQSEHRGGEAWVEVKGWKGASNTPSVAASGNLGTGNGGVSVSGGKGGDSASGNGNGNGTASAAAGGENGNGASSSVRSVAGMVVGGVVGLVGLFLTL